MESQAKGRLNILKIHKKHADVHKREPCQGKQFETEYKEALLSLIRNKDANSRSLEKTISKYVAENPEKNELSRKLTF